MGYPCSRRQFFHRVSAVTATALLGKSAHASVPSHRISECLNVAIIGVGAMGRAHLDYLSGHAGVHLSAVADPDGQRRQSARECAAQRRLRVPAYADYREMLHEHHELDAVFIATPDHWHARAALDCMQAGKDVYGEKPLARTIAEGRRIVEAARRHGRIFQLGTQQRSDYPHFRHVCELIRNGRIGEVRRVVCFFGPNPYADAVPAEAPPDYLDWSRYLGPVPWRPYNRLVHPANFRYFRAFAGGLITDWGVHLFDIAQWALEKDGTSPRRIEAEGEFAPGNAYDVPRRMRVQYDYDDVTLEWRQGMGGDVEAGQRYGTKFYGAEGEIFVNRAGYWARCADGRPLDEHLGAHAIRLDTALNHREDFLASVRTRRAPLCGAEIGHRASALAHLGNLALDAGMPLEYDPIREAFLTDRGTRAANREGIPDSACG